MDNFVKIKLFQGFEYETTKKIEEDFLVWMENQTKNNGKIGTIGDRFSYRITPTSIGLIVSVVDELANKEFCLTDFDLL